MISHPDNKVSVSNLCLCAFPPFLQVKFEGLSTDWRIIQDLLKEMKMKSQPTTTVIRETASVYLSTSAIPSSANKYLKAVISVRRFVGYVCMSCFYRSFVFMSISVDKMIVPVDLLNQNYV